MSRITEAFHGVWTSLVRTFTPWIVGVVVGFLASTGITLDPELESSLTVLISVLAGAIYYAIVRVLERFAPKLGWLLLSPRQPVYVKPDAVEVVESTATVANEAVEQ